MANLKDLSVNEQIVSKMKQIKIYFINLTDTQMSQTSVKCVKITD